MSFKIVLPDNSVKVLERPVSIHDFAALIGPGLARVAIGGKVDGKITDIRTLLEKDCSVQIITDKSPEANEIVRHSAAHIMAQAIQKLWPEVKITIGPVIENGFFYDLDSPRNFVPEDLQKIEAEMKKIVDADLEIKREVWSVEKALQTFKDMKERFKVEIIQDLVKNEGVKEVSVYYQGDWFDLCRGPHVPRTSFLKAFKLMSIAGAYWRGDEKNPMLQRIYGTAFSNKKDLDQYLLQIEESKKRDHRKLGKELDLFMFHSWSPAAPFFLPRGTIIYNELLKYIRELYRKYGYEEVVTPQVFDMELFKCSGHYDNYRDNMYFATPADLKADTEDLKESMLKAMNCPAHALMYGSKKHSYRELPVRLADFGRLHRYERAGVVHGLARVRSFSQDDAHIFCTQNQLQDEISKFMTMLNEAYQTFGFNEYKVYFSTRPEKRMGEETVWDKAEGALEAALKNLNLSYTVNAGDGAFYGPKLDIMVTDAIGRAWQLGTLQCDFNLGYRFDLEYIGEDNKGHKPVVLHRAILGSLERFLAVLIEHCAGTFPLWLSPEQVVIINISEAQMNYAQELKEKLEKKDLRVTLDLRNEKLGYKIREAQLRKVPYMVILGDKELASQTLSVRLKSGKEVKDVAINSFVDHLSNELKTRAPKGSYE